MKKPLFIVVQSRGDNRFVNEDESSSSLLFYISPFSLKSVPCLECFLLPRCASFSFLACLKGGNEFNCCHFLLFNNGRGIKSWMQVEWKPALRIVWSFSCKSEYKRKLYQQYFWGSSYRPNEDNTFLSNSFLELPSKELNVSSVRRLKRHKRKNQRTSHFK